MRVGRGESFPDGAGVERETGESVLSLKKAKREAAAQRRPAKTTRKTAFFFRETPGRMVCNAKRLTRKMLQTQDALCFLRGKKPLCFVVDARKALWPNRHGPAGRLSVALCCRCP